MFQLLVLSCFLALVHGANLPLGLARGIGQAPIIGGELAVISDAPWTVSLEYFFTHRCGGTIISPTVVLTSATCVYWDVPGFWVVRAGSSFIHKGGQYVEVSRTVTHPNYSTLNWDYNVAVAILSSPISIDNVNTRIATLPIYLQNIPAGAGAFVTGWGTPYLTSPGLSPQLRKVTVPVVDQTVCVKAYEDTNYPVSARMVCAGEGGKDTCSGDNGGPFIVDGLLVGVTSHGSGCADALFPKVYARVPAMVDWINNQIK